MSGALALIETGTESLIHYEQARHALEMARTADEVNHVRGLAAGLIAAARVAQNREMEVNAAELRLRALRRLGQLLISQKESVGFNLGGRPPETGSNSEPVIPTLEEMGLDKKISMECQNMAQVPTEKFEGQIIHWRRRHEDGKSRVTLSLYFNGDAPGIPHRPLSKCPLPSPPKEATDLDYHEIVWLLIERKKALGISQAIVDDLSGWTESLTSKFEIPHMDTGRIASGIHLVEWARALGLGLALVPLR
jgi:hypothetical protein